MTTVSGVASTEKINAACAALGAGFIAQDVVPLLQQLVIALGNVTSGGGGGGTTLPTGFMGYSAVDVRPDGWVRANGGTIGSASSGATELASASTASLFALFWNNYGNGECPVSGGRGASAAADFAANKTLALPDATGRVLASLGSGAFYIIGTTPGAETIVLSENELPVVSGHKHSIPVDGNYVSVDTGSANQVAIVNYGETGEAGGFGGGAPHNNVQPTLVVGCAIIKL